MNEQSLKKISFESCSQNFFEYHTVMAMIIGLFTLLATSTFLYFYFYKSLINTEVAASLTGQVANFKADTSLYTEVAENINNKKIPPDIKLEQLKNPFMPYSAEPIYDNVTPAETTSN